MRSAVTVVFVLLTCCMLMGMGTLGETPEGEIPKTDENVKAQLVDRGGVSTELSRFSMEGKLFITGKRGSGDMSVFFRDLKEVSFGAVNGNIVPANLHLKSGDSVQLNVDKNIPFYGDTGHGIYHILAGDVSRIVFHK